MITGDIFIDYETADRFEFNEYYNSGGYSELEELALENKIKK